MYIGKKLKEIRKAQGMTLAQLAEKSQVQIATISRIENLKMTGTLESHMRIAQALGVDVTQLYGEAIREENPVEVKTPKSETDVFVHSDKSSYEILANKVLSKKMMPILLKIEPGGQTNPEQNAPGAERFVYVLEGDVDVVIGKNPYSLSMNNSLYFSSTEVHYFVNSGEKVVKVLSVTTPVTL